MYRAQLRHCSALTLLLSSAPSPSESEYFKPQEHSRVEIQTQGDSSFRLSAAISHQSHPISPISHASGAGKLLGNAPLIRTQTSSDQRRAYLHLPFDLHLLVYLNTEKMNAYMWVCVGFFAAVSRCQVIGQLLVWYMDKYRCGPHKVFVKGAEIR